jgi:hypothetical protein
MREVRIALLSGLTLTVIAIGLVLSQSPPAVTGPKRPLNDNVNFGESELGARICQANEVLPGGTTSIRVWLEAVVGPAVSIEVLSGRHVLTRGARGTGWTAGSVTIPVTNVGQTALHATVCVKVQPSREPIGLFGTLTRPAVAAIDRQGPLRLTAHAHAPMYRQGPLPGRIAIEYLRAGSNSWWSLGVSVARRMGLGHAGSGSWLAVLALLLMTVLAATVSWLILTELT